MARVPYLNAEDLDEADRDVLQRPFHLWRALANSPATSREFQRIVGHLWNGNRLDRRTVELVILQVAAVCGVPYEWVHHVRLGLQNGVLPEEIRAIGATGTRGGARFGPRESAALDAALEIARDGAYSDATHARLAAVFDAGERVDLTMTAATYVGVARFLSSLRIDVEDECRHVLDAHPVPGR
jgi:alkylhydroperoxidase family enzyme